MFTGLHDSSRWVLPAVLEEMAQKKPHALWVGTTDGDEASFGAMADDVRRMAGYFAGLGVRKGDCVAVWMHNGLDFVRVWLGLGRLGAVAVLLNTELRGAFLEHQLNNSGARLAVVDVSLQPALAEVVPGLTQLRQLIVVGRLGNIQARLPLLDWNVWRSAAPWEGPMPQAYDMACVMYTSGTTGPSKGVLMPHAHCALYGVGAIECLQMQPDDKYYISLPLFHANGLLMQLGATLLGGIPAVLRQRFSASAWLSDLQQYGATVTNLLGSTAAFIIAQPPTEGDRNHRLRAALTAPNLAVHEAVFRERFGVRDVVSGFGMTEINIPIWGRLGVSVPNAAGWAHEQHFEVVIADSQTDAPVPPGELGEILVRPKVPFGFMAGYHGMPEKAAEAWRNLWFHTGDAGTMTADGLVTFVDRIKDCIRRRGENISAAEVELAVGSLPSVAEVAAYAVPSDLPGGEDEVMLALVLAPGYEMTLEAIGEQADALLPRFAKPRFLRRMDQLPKTATGKIQRAALKKEGTRVALDRTTGLRGEG
ncbi:AMP-binding protein [Caballeronia sp. LjRoot34]|uniref:AMP-binding protein n=1 Tax=Caballeronia sp. LjRoot34 TaxID=3342325 RepID=UPI003ECE1D84